MSHTAGPARSAPEQAVAYWNAVQSEIAAINVGRDKAFDQVLPSLRSIRSGDDGFCVLLMVPGTDHLPLSSCHFQGTVSGLACQDLLVGVDLFEKLAFDDERVAPGRHSGIGLSVQCGGDLLGPAATIG